MSTEYSAFDAPRLPPPAAPPGRPLTAPSEPSPALPPPSPPSSLPSSLPGGLTTVAGVHDHAEDSDGVATPRSRGTRLPIGWLLVAFAVAIVGLATFLMFRGGNGDEPDASRGDAPLGPAALDAQASDSMTAAGQILDDAQAVVDDMNDRSDEREILAELGLDENANPTDDLQGYRFTWADPSGQDLDIIVDLTTENFAVDASDGISFRMIDGTFYGSVADSDEWFELAEDPFGDTPVIGLGGLPDIEGVIPDATAPFLVNSGLKDGGSGPTYFFIVDDEAFHAADPEARAEWLRPWGLIEPSTVEPTTLVVTITLDPLGERVIGAQIETPTIGGFASFSVVETLDTAPVIEVPGS